MAACGSKSDLMESWHREGRRQHSSQPTVNYLNILTSRWCSSTLFLLSYSISNHEGSSHWQVALQNMASVSSLLLFSTPSGLQILLLSIRATSSQASSILDSSGPVHGATPPLQIAARVINNNRHFPLLIISRL